MNAEQLRLEEARQRRHPWRKWGPYLSQRQWGTVREDYSPHGTAWDYFGHDRALSRAYRWGEDGIGGLSDEKQRICLSVALWNGRDPFLKERLFGLTGTQGNHGEDVKELLTTGSTPETPKFRPLRRRYPRRQRERSRTSRWLCQTAHLGDLDEQRTDENGQPEQAATEAVEREGLDETHCRRSRRLSPLLPHRQLTRWPTAD